MHHSIKKISALLIMSLLGIANTALASAYQAGDLIELRPKSKEFTGQVIDVHDGDTITIIPTTPPVLTGEVQAFSQQADGTIHLSIMPQQTSPKKKQKAQKIKLRLSKIDAPEIKQAFGIRARNYLQTLILHRNISIQTIDTDRYGRKLAIIYLGKENINLQMVRKGYAWVFKEYTPNNPQNSAYYEAEQLAKQEKLGLWQDKRPIYPQTYRKQQEKKKH